MPLCCGISSCRLFVHVINSKSITFTTALQFLFLESK
jgi:hypothetical protein